MKSWFICSDFKSFELRGHWFHLIYMESAKIAGWLRFTLGCPPFLVATPKYLFYYSDHHLMIKKTREIQKVYIFNIS